MFAGIKDRHDELARYALLTDLEASNLHGTTMGRTRVRNVQLAPVNPNYLHSSEEDSDEIYK